MCTANGPRARNDNECNQAGSVETKRAKVSGHLRFDWAGSELSICNRLARAVDVGHITGSYHGACSGFPLIWIAWRQCNGNDPVSNRAMRDTFGGYQLTLDVVLRRREQPA